MGVNFSFHSAVPSRFRPYTLVRLLSYTAGYF
jgi:hypothetical protein